MDPSPRPKKRRVLWVLGGLLASVLAVTWALATGWPQRAAVEFAAGYILDARVHVIGLTSIGVVRLDEIRVYLASDSAGTSGPAFIARNVEVDYSLFPSKGRYIESVSIGSLEAYLSQGWQQAQQGYAERFEERETRNRGRRERPFLPKMIEIGAITAHLSGDSGRLQVSGLGFRGTFGDAHTFATKLVAPTLAATWGVGDTGTLHRVHEGVLRFHLVRQGQTLRGEAVLGVPGVVEGRATFGGKITDSGYDLEGAFQPLRLYGSYLEPLLHAFVPDNLHFGRLVFTNLGGSLAGNYEGFPKWEAGLAATLQDFAMEGRAFACPDGGCTFAAKVHGADPSEGEMKIELRADLGEGTVEATVARANDGALHGEVRLQDIGLAPWMADTDSDKEVVAAVLNGIATVTLDPATREAEIVPKFVVSGLDLHPLAPKSVEITGTVHLLEGYRQAQIQNLTLNAGEGISFTVQEGRVDFDPLQGSVTYSGRADLLELLGQEDLWGEAVGGGFASFDGEGVEAEFELESDTLGYGDLSVPYGTKATASAHFHYDFDSKSGTILKAAASLGETTHLRSSLIRFATDPLTLEGAYELESDYTVLVESGWLDEGEGSLHAQGKIRFANDRLSAEWVITGEMAHGVFRDASVACTDAVIVVKGGYDEVLNGEGTLRVASISAAGAKLRGLSATIRLEGKSIILSDVAGSLFDTEATAYAEAGVLQEGFPLRLRAQAEGLDLAAFTREVQPPNIKLTGMADGSVAITYAGGNLSEFTVYLKSDEDFSLNREAVEDVVLSDQFRSALPAGPVERIMDKFLGAESQRPFDSAELRIGLEEGRIRGLVDLRSVKTRAYNGLNLSIDIAIDPPALAETFKMLEESASTHVEF